MQGGLVSMCLGLEFWNFLGQAWDLCSSYFGHCVVSPGSSLGGWPRPVVQVQVSGGGVCLVTISEWGGPFEIHAARRRDIQLWECLNVPFFQVLLSRMYLHGSPQASRLPATLMAVQLYIGVYITVTIWQ